MGCSPVPSIKSVFQWIASFSCILVPLTEDTRREKNTLSFELSSEVMDIFLYFSGYRDPAALSVTLMSKSCGSFCLCGVSADNGYGAQIPASAQRPWHWMLDVLYLINICTCNENLQRCAFMLCSFQSGRINTLHSWQQLTNLNLHFLIKSLLFNVIIHIECYSNV